MEKSNKGETWNESIFYEGNESITSIKLVLNHDHLSFSQND